MEEELILYIKNMGLGYSLIVLNNIISLFFCNIEYLNYFILVVIRGQEKIDSVFPDGRKAEAKRNSCLC